MAIDPLGKYGKIDMGKYGKTFDNMFGAGAYDKGIASARDNGTRIGTLKRERALWEEQQRELEKVRKELEAMQKKEAKKRQTEREKAEDQGRGGHLPTRDNQLKQRKAIEKSDKKYGSISNNDLIPRTDMTEYRKHLMGMPSEWVEKKTKKKKKKEDKGFFGNLADGAKDILGEVGSAGKAAVQGFNPLDDVSMKEAFDNYASRDRGKAVKGLQRGSNRAVDSASLGIMSNLDQKLTGERPYYTSSRKIGEGGGTDMLTSGLGYLVPGVGAAKTIRGLSGMTTAGRAALAQPIASKAGLGLRALEGAVAGGGITSAEVGIREALNPQNFSAKQNLADIGLNTAAGAVLDPLADLGLSALTKRLGRSGTTPATPEASMAERLGLPAPQGSSAPLGLPAPQARLGAPKPPPDFSGMLDMFGQRTRPNVGRPLTPDALSNNLTASKFGKRPVGYWKTRYEDFANHVKTNYDSNQLTKESLEESWRNFARKDENVTLDQLVDLYTRDSASVTSQIPFGQQSVPSSRKPARLIGNAKLPDNLERLLSPQEPPVTPDLLRLDLQSFSRYGGPSARISDVKTKGLKEGTDYTIADRATGTVKLSDSGVEKLASSKDFDPSRLVGGHVDKITQFRSQAAVNPQKMAKAFKAEGMKQADAETAYKAVVQNPDPVPMSENPIAASAQARGKVIDHRNELKKAADSSRKLGEGRLSRAFSSFQKNWIDDQAYIKYAENDLTGKSRIAPKGEAARAFQLVNGSAGKAEYVLTRELSPVFSRLQKKGGDTEQALEYMTALHMQELDKSFKAQGKEYVFPGGYDVNHFNNIVDINKGRPEYEEFTESISKYTDKLLDELQSAGVLSSDAVKEMKGQYKYYVPKYRQQDLEPDAFESAFYNNFSSISSKNPVKSLKEGSDEPIQDIVSSLEAMTFKTMQSAASNNAKKKLADLASLDTKGRWISKTKSGNKIEYFDKGEKKEIFVNKELAEAIKGADPVEVNSIAKMARSLSKFQRLSITGSPAFVARNAIRDAQQSWMNSKSGFTAYDYAVSALDVITDGKFLGKKSNLDKFYESGAASSNIWSQDKTQFRTFQNQAFKQKKGFKDNIDPRKYMDWYRENILEKSDYFPKMAEFRAAKRKGYSDDEAAYMARDLMDFFRAGKEVRKVNPYVGFLNATIQGRSRFMRSFSDSVAEKDVKRGLRIVTRNAMGAVVPSVMAFTTYQALSDDDIRKKTIDEAPAYLRDTFWLLPHPNGKDVIRIPKPFEAAAYFSNAVEYVLRADAGIATDVNETASKWLLDNVFFNPSLNILNPIYETAFNKDTFTDAPIVPQREQNLPTSEQYDASTSYLARGLGAGIGKLPLMGDSPLSSPRIVDNLIEGAFPVGGKQALNAMDSGLAATGAVPDKNLPAGGQNPYMAPLTDVLGQFRVPTDGRTSPLVSKVYDTNDTMKGRKKMAENGNFDPSVPIVDLGSQVSALNEISKQIRTTLNDPNMEPEAKRDAINMLTNQRNEIARALQSQGLLE